MPAIAALLPACNGRLRGSVVLRTRQYADRPRDDGSSDHTAEVASLAGAEVLRHIKNQGKGAALKTGFSSLNGDAVIVTIDTDGQLWLGGHFPPGGAHTEGRGGYGQRYESLNTRIYITNHYGMDTSRSPEAE